MCMNDSAEIWIGLHRALREAGFTKKAALYYYLDKPDGVRSKLNEKGTRRMYNLADCHRLKTRRLARQKGTHGKENNFEVGWLTIADLPALLDLDLHVQSPIENYHLYRSWLEKNPYLALCVFDKDDRRKCLAYVSALPLSEQTIFSVLLGERNERDIHAEDILDQAEGCLLISHVGGLEEKYMRAVLRTMMVFCLQSKIKRLYVQTTDEDGEALAKRLGCSALFILEKRMLIPHAFVLDLEQPLISKTLRRWLAE